MPSPTATTAASAGVAGVSAAPTATTAASHAAFAQAVAERIEHTTATHRSSGPVGEAVATIRGQEVALARECLTTLKKIVDNILSHPMEDKYRKIKRTNAGFKRKVRFFLCC